MSSEYLNLLIIFLCLLCFVVYLIKSVFVIQENQRMVVLRMGKVNQVMGPGLCVLVPFTDLGIVVDLNKHIPKWLELSEEELKDKLIYLVRENPNPKVYK